ncbi:MAG TPA: sensor histidine kinase [Solirubrobacterales bacterium]|nr:sensor histidine kinase [Solirubrobacterales bacterium]
MIGLRRALVALGVLAFLLGLGSAALVTTSDHASPRGLLLAVVLIAGWSFAFTGLYAWGRRPGNNIGPLMTAVGFTWFFQAFSTANNPWLFALGFLGQTLPFAILVHLLVSFPSGRLQTRLQKVAVGLAYLATGPLQIVWALFIDPSQQSDCGGCPENPILIDGAEGISEIVNVFQVLGGVTAIAIAIGLLYRNWRRSTETERRVLTPVLATGGLAFSILLVQLTVGELGASNTFQSVTFVASITVFSCLPFAFLFGLLRSRIGRAEEVTTALSAENEQLTAELEAKVEELRASRHRIVEAGYAERRRVERDLHDGAQQRLMALTMTLRLAREKMDADPAASAELLDEAMEELSAATAELREFARGIHPVVLSDRGLGAALDGLAERSPVPVEIAAAPAERLPTPVESAAYFVVAESLTNVARYADAELATVRVERRNGSLEVEISDDGSGGADPDAGSGLRGLADRVAALDGSFTVRSEAGEGTTVEARIPCA